MPLPIRYSPVMQLPGLKQLRSPVFIGGFVVLAALLVLGLIRWPVGNDLIGERLRHALDRNTGYVIESAGEVHFTALPWPTLQIEDLALRKPSSPHERVIAPLLKARLNLGSWLFGSPKVVGLSLFDPVIHLVTTENVSDTEALSTAVFNFLAREGRPELQTLRVARGSIVLDGAPWMQDLLLNVSNTAGADLRLRMEGRYRGNPVAIRADVGQGASRDQRPISWTAVTPSLSTRFDGVLFSPRSLDAEGDFALTITDGPGLARTLDAGARHATLLTNARLSGQARVVWPMIQIRQAVIEQGRDRLEGSVEMTVDASHPALSATLDGQRLDMTQLLGPVLEQLTVHTGTWSNQPLNTGIAGGAKVDLRLSAQRLQIGSIGIDRAALSAHLRDGRIELLLNEGQIADGSLKGRISLSPDPAGGVAIRAQSSFDKLDLGLILEAAGVPRLRGTGAGTFSLAATGSSMAQLAGTLEGRARMTVRDGELPGTDLDRLPGRIERTLAGGFPIDGKTRFQTLGLQLRFAKGVATITDGTLITPVIRAPLAGTIDVSRQHLDLTARLQPGGDLPRAGEMRVRLEGPWSAPVLTPDLAGRGNRS
jgi:AsmA protein